MIIERTVLSNAQLHEGNRGVLRFFDLERHPRAPGVKGAPLGRRCRQRREVLPETRKFESPLSTSDPHKR